MNNNSYTVLLVFDGKTELLFENKYITSLDIDELSEEINQEISKKENKEFLDTLFSSDNYINFIQNIKISPKFFGLIFLFTILYK